MISPGTRIRSRSLDHLPFLLVSLLGLDLLLLGVLHVLAWIIPQQPGYVETEAEYQAWLRGVATASPWVVRAARAGLSALRTSPFHQALLLLAVALALIHIAQALYLAFWPRPGGDVPPLSPQAAEEGRFEHLTRPFADVQAEARQRLASLQVVAEAHPNYQEARYFARGGMGGLWGSVLFFLGLALLSLGLYMDAALAWETRPTILAPGQSWDLGHSSGIRVSLLAEEETGANAGDLFLVQRGAEASGGKVHVIPVGGALVLGEVEIRHLDAPPGLRLQATTSSGVAVPLLTPDGHAGRAVVLVFPTSGDERTVIVPTYGLEVRVVGYASLPERGFPDQVFLVQVLAEDREEPVRTEFVTGSSRLDVAGITLQATAVRHARVQARYRPGRVWRWGGIAMTLVGLVWALWRGPFRRVWLQLYGHERATIVQTWEERYVLGWRS